MSESPVVEMTALDAKALRELIEGLIAEVKALRFEVERLRQPAAAQGIPVTTCWPITTGDPPRPYPYTAVGVVGGAGAAINPRNLLIETCEWWGDPNDAPCLPPRSAN